MTPTVPTLTLKQLADMGKQQAEHVIAYGQFFFPQMLVGYADHIQQASYEGNFEEFTETVSFLAAQGPIEWLAHTGDSYCLTGSLPVDDPLMRQVLTGERRLAELFEDDHPSVTEAIVIILVTKDGTESVELPYRRRGDGRVVWTNPANVSRTSTDADVQGRYADAMRVAIELSHRHHETVETDLNGEDFS
jgi:hypothetical protein